MARRSWRDDARPPASPLLRRAVAHAGAAVLPAVLLCQRIQRAVVRFLLSLPGFLRRPCPPPPPRAAPPPPPPSPPPPRNHGGACASLYGRLPKATRTTPASSPSPVQSTSTPEPVIVDGELVPQGVVDLYVEYCKMTCPRKSTVCHFCMFEMQRALNFTVPTDTMFMHCNEKHDLEEPSIRCNESGCRVRVRPGRDQTLHVHFCHRLHPGWWREYSR